MSTIGSTGGILGSAAGAPISQATGTAAERSQRDSAEVQRRADAEAKAEQAGGIGQTEEDEQTDERDADGRRLWERSRRTANSDADRDDAGLRQSKDTSGASGNSLDLLG
jgi:hypothetical protein